MRIISSVDELKKYREEIEGKKIGFVATMGALHNGHKSLMIESKKQNDLTIVSIFVNPTQFGVGEDYASYPRDLDSDVKVCESVGVDAIFTPNASELYKDMEISILAPKNMGYVLEGFDRPTHFNGVLSVVAKLFNLVRPHNAYFGQKDAQQVVIIKSMVNSLFMPINIVPCEIVRDSDGVALSSRNRYLSIEQRKIAQCLPQCVNEVKNAIKNGEKEVANLLKIALKNLNHKDIHIFYVEFVDTKLSRIQSIKQGESMMLLAVRIGTTRLLDNLFI